MDITLDLRANGDYALTVDSIYVSKGRWGIKDNTVILYDSYFKSNYLLTIKNKTKLISSLIPMDFWNMEFTSESELIKYRNERIRKQKNPGLP
jgi:hypothetical protein